MVWKLSDLCLECVQQNLDLFSDNGNYFPTTCNYQEVLDERIGCHDLPTHYKEVLVERLACHDRYFPQHLKYISRSLFSSRLRHICFDRCDQINDEVLQELGKANPTFESLILKSLHNVTDVGVQAVTENQQSLVQVHLKKLRNITQGALQFISSSKLSIFKLKHKLPVSKNWCTQTALHDFLARNPNIKVLKIDTETENIPVIAQGLRSSLNELSICFQSVTDAMIEVLAECCPNLLRLDLNGAKFVGKESLIKLFQACTQLSELDLGYCSRLACAPENEALWTLPQSLTGLSLCGMMMSDQKILVECITRLPHIRHLKLCGVPALTDSTLKQIVEKMGSRLTSVNLSSVYSQEITDVGLAAVAKYCTSLEALHISLLKNITGTTLMPIFSNPKRAAKITTLVINNRLMNINVLDQVMTSCQNIEVLDLSGLPTITDQMLITLADNAPNLKKIYLKGCKLVTDKSVCYLSSKCPLIVLGLSGIQSLTDKSIFCLASSVPHLEEIYLNGCSNISPVAVQYLQDRCLGRLIWMHNIPNASPNQLMAKNLDTGEFCRADLLPV